MLPASLCRCFFRLSSGRDASLAALNRKFWLTALPTPPRAVATPFTTIKVAPQTQRPLDHATALILRPPLDTYGAPATAPSPSRTRKKIRAMASTATIPGLSLHGNVSSLEALKMPDDSARPRAKRKGRQSKYALRKQAEAEARGARQSLVATQPSAEISGHPSMPSAGSAADRNRVRDPRQYPSEESGGVPDPSASYMARAQGPPSLLSQPRRILVIVDLNGTLLFRPDRKRPSHFVPRPHASRFLHYCLDTFVVALWSSARPANVDKMVDRLLAREQRERCVVVWARDRFQLSKDDYNLRVQCYKRLSRIWADPDVQASHPGAPYGGRWDQSNTVLIDDSLEKARTEPFNILQIPEFAGLLTELVHVLPQVHDYLNGLCYQSDISRFIRTKPFVLDPAYKLPPDGVP